jgi:hypothetical protein
VAGPTPAVDSYLTFRIRGPRCHMILQ